MCGRYSLHSSPEVVALQLGVGSLPAFAPRYNIAPDASALIVAREGAQLSRWGLRGSRHNARADSLAKPLYRRASRCLIPANGFYEWKRSGSLSQPYYVHPSSQPLFTFAGLWEDERFAVITTEANSDMSPIHDRMPVIIAPQDYAGWLNGADELLRPAPKGSVLAYPVSPAVNRAANESPALIAPLDSEIEPGLFD
jgi:putative SOS response-associated peptidase YedK